MNCILWHKWGVWSKPEEKYMQRVNLYTGYKLGNYYALKQTRICEKCGKVEVKYTELGG